MKRITVSFVASALLFATCAFTLGCPSQQVDSLLLITAGNAAAAYFNATGDTDKAQKSTEFAQLVSKDAASFVPGTKSQDAIQAIEDFAQLLTAADIGSSPTASYVGLSLSTVIQVLADIQGATPTTSSIEPHTNTRLSLPPAPKNKAAFDKAWNAQLAIQPVAGLSPLN